MRYLLRCLNCEVGYYKEYNLPKHQDELYTIKEITNRSSIDIDN